MPERKQFRNFKKREQSLPIEKKIEKFIIRNSQNGYFTKVSTIPYKFEISENRTWDIVGELLIDGKLESIHDEVSGEMKLCETGKIYSIMSLEKKRKIQKNKKTIKKEKEKIENDENLPAQCHPPTKLKNKKSKGTKNETM